MKNKKISQTELEQNSRENSEAGKHADIIIDGFDGSKNEIGSVSDRIKNTTGKIDNVIVIYNKRKTP